MKTKFKSKALNEHIRVEEGQWVEIFEEGNAFASMLLLQVEKLCTLAHEIERLLKADNVSVEQVKSLASGLVRRIEIVLEMFPDAEESFKAEELFRELKAGIEKLGNDEGSLKVLEESVDRIHKSCHLLVDEIHEKLCK